MKNKTLDYLLSPVRYMGKKAKKGLLITTLVATLALSSCGYDVFIQGVKIDRRRDYTTPAIVTAIIAGAAWAYENDRRRKADKDDDIPIYFPIVGGGGEGPGGPGGN